MRYAWSFISGSIYIIPAILYNMDFICICCDFMSEIDKESICDFTSAVCGRYVCNFIIVSTYVCLCLEFICLWCDLISEINMGFICDFFYSECVWVVSAQLCFCYLLRLGSHLLKNTFGAVLPSESIWICVHVRLIYHAWVIINWGMQFGVWKPFKWYAF